MHAEKIVREFCEAASTLNVDTLLGFFTEDAVYHNMPIAPVEGKAAIGETLTGFLGPASACSFELLSIAASGNRVLTERIDHFEVEGKRISLPVMGTFEVTPEGRISAWRDYFDLQQYMQQVQG
jgi:limonene-1,2-epoxide hydrolase